MIEPKLIERHCGGWLAVSADSEPLKIGTTGGDEREAREEYYRSYKKWRSYSPDLMPALVELSLAMDALDDFST